MAEYDFSGLSPSDFESLCRDLLSRHLNVPLQSFTDGRDKGIDLRHAPIPGNDWIVQCKHFVRSGYAKLRSHLKRNELPIVRKLNPSRYIIATSVGLTPQNVDDLFELFTPYCRSKHDIIGRSDLNAFLRDNPRIEKAHIKLWVTSEAVLSRVLQNDVFVQSSMTEEDIRRKLAVFVFTQSLPRARKKLERERVCILSGVPGVGKTTMAEMLIMRYLMEEWELVSIHQNVSEGMRVFRSDPGAKQLFYYDDFLGQISVGEKLDKNEDRVLLQLVESVARTAHKRLLLTTREYILAQAKVQHERLSRSDIDLHKFVVSCSDYSDVDKARILANHLYFWNVPQSHIRAIIASRTYKEIISHRNYSPRIIESMTRSTETSQYPAPQYPGRFLARLDNPSELWNHAFENQISEASRHLLLVLGSCGNAVTVSDLKHAFEQFFFPRTRDYGFSASPSSFDSALRELEDNFVRIDRNHDNRVVQFHNPSVLDFLRARLTKDASERNALLRAASFFEQVDRLVLVFRDECDNVQNIDPLALQKAISQTLSAPSIRLMRATRTDTWFGIRDSIWSRLRTCCRMGEEFSNPQLRAAIEEQIKAAMANAALHNGQMQAMTTLIGTARSCDWISRDNIVDWNLVVWRAVVTEGRAIPENLDGLSALATWVSENRGNLTDGEANQASLRLANATDDLAHQYADEHDRQRLEDDLATVQEISAILGCDLSTAVSALEDAIATSGYDDDNDDDRISNDDNARNDNATIDDIFGAFDCVDDR
jgi:DNA polymerase III delta prime subunit